MLFASLFIGSASAGGYFLTDVGARGAGRGGAFVAGANDISAIWYNPAALIRSKNGRVGIHLAGVKQYINFDRADYPDEGPDGDLINGGVENEDAPMTIPHFGVIYDFGLPNTAFYLGLSTPYAGDFGYPENGGQRYSVINTSVIQTYAGPAVAHRFNDWISLGAGLSWSYLSTELSRNIAIYSSLHEGLAKDIEDPAYDAGFEVFIEDKGAFSWNAGALIEPPDKSWAIGLGYQAPTKYNAKGNLKADFSNHIFYGDDGGIIAVPSVQDDDISIDVTLPMLVKIGALIRPAKGLELETAFVYEGWSGFHDLVVDDLSMNLETSLGDQVIEGPITLPTGYIDTYSVRLGGHYQPLEGLTIRSGALYETGAVPDDKLNLSMVDTDKWGYGLGLTYAPTNNIEVDFAWSQSFYTDKEISGSDVSRLAAVVDIASQETAILHDRPVADGSYSSSGLIFAAGLSWRFGGPDKPMQKPIEAEQKKPVTTPTPTTPVNPDLSSGEIEKSAEKTEDVKKALDTDDDAVNTNNKKPNQEADKEASPESK